MKPRNSVEINLGPLYCSNKPTSGWSLMGVDFLDFWETADWLELNSRCKLCVEKYSSTKVPLKCVGKYSSATVQ